MKITFRKADNFTHDIRVDGEKVGKILRYHADRREWHLYAKIAGGKYIDAAPRIYYAFLRDAKDAAERLFYSDQHKRLV